MALEEVKKHSPLDRSNRTWVQRLSGHFVWSTRHGGSQANNFARFYDAKKKSLAIHRIYRESYSTFEEKKDQLRFAFLLE